jgi:hypothetical protein
MELHHPTDREDEVGRLEASVGRIPVAELPLLAAELAGRRGESGDGPCPLPAAPGLTMRTTSKDTAPTAIATENRIQVTATPP